MIRTLCRTALAVLLAAPGVAAAQQQQGAPHASEQLSRAKSLIAKKRYKAALALFDSLTRAEPGSRDAVLGRAQMLSWLGRFAEALRAYERWVAAHPDDVAAAERLAQVLAWAGRLDDAERIYKLLAAGGSPESERGLARITGWRGRHLEAERQWRAILARRPNDAEAWVGLSYVLRWTNRPREARAALILAVRADPTNGDAVEQLKLVEAALAPHVDPSVGSISDTDGNSVMTMAATVALAAPWDGELSGRVQRRAAANGPSRASTLSGAVSASRSTGRFAYRGSVGATRFDNGSGVPGASTRDAPLASVSATAALGRATVGVGAGREPFDETAAIIRRGMVITAVGGGVTADLARRITVSGKFEHARLTGATPNTRTSGSAWVRWRAPYVLSLMTNVQAFGYASDPREGYFAPRRYLLTEAGAQVKLGGELGWSVTFDGAAGAQSLDVRAAGAETQPAARVAGGILYRPSPGLEWGLSAFSANSASPATTSLTSYRASGWMLRGRVSF